MPIVTFLSDWEVRSWSSVPDDKDCNDILQELRTLSGENWLVEVRHWSRKRLLRRPVEWKAYTLYADCNGEWQVINLVTPRGGSVFHSSQQSREDVMNFMLGYIAGLHFGERKNDVAA